MFERRGPGDAAPHNVKDSYDDACLYFAHAIQIAAGLGLADEVKRLRKRNGEINAVYNHQFRYVGR
jgi:hypothetical protein